MRGPWKEAPLIRSAPLPAVLLLVLALAAGCASPRADAPATRADGGEPVVLVHGLWRSSLAMRPLEERLRAEGYRACSVDYPSTDAAPEDLVVHLDRELRERCRFVRERVHFVTHSLGGILVRAYLAGRRSVDPGRVVMLAPPNRGSEWVDAFAGGFLVRWLLGPTARLLGTGPESLPNRLGPPDYEVGVIAGTRASNLLAMRIIPGESDGTVSVASTKLEGMTDFVAVAETHVSIKRAPAVADQVLRFLRLGSFRHAGLDQAEAGAAPAGVAPPPKPRSGIQETANAAAATTKSTR